MTASEFVLAAAASSAAEALPETETTTETVQLDDLLAQHELYSLSTIFFICALLGCVLAAYVWRGD